jgi:hypothetical protein
MHEADRLPSTADIAELRKLEETLWLSETRSDNNLMGQTFAPDFLEFGRSGRFMPERRCCSNRAKTKESLRSCRYPGSTPA